MAAPVLLRLRADDGPFARMSLALLGLGTTAGLAASASVAALASRVSPVFTFIGSVAIPVVVGMFLSPRFAVLVLCASLPFERIGRLTDDVDRVAISASRILGLVALGSLLLHSAIRREKLRFGLAFWLYAGYTGIAFLSCAWSSYPDDTLRDSFRILGNLLFFFVVINAIRTYDLAKKTMLVWLVASLCAGAFSLADYYLLSRHTVTEREMGLTSERRATVLEDGAEARTLGVNVKRLFGTTAHPTLFGLNMLMTVPFLLWAYQGTRSTTLRLVWIGGVVVAALSIVLSNTRAVLLLAALTAVMCCWRLWRPNVKTVVALGLSALLIVPFIPEDVYRRTLDPGMYTLSKADGLRVRLKFWAKAWELIEDNWLRGIGVGDQTTVVEMITDESAGNLTPAGLRASAHNEYIWVLAEVGIVGYLLHWGFVGLVTAAGFRAAARLRRVLAARDEYVFVLACQVLMVGILLFAVQSEVFHYPLKGWWLTAGLATTMLHLARTNPEYAPAG